MKFIYKLIIIAFVLFILAIPTMATTDPCDDPDAICMACTEECMPCSNIACEPCITQNCQGNSIPIDGGLLWLILGGVGVGAKRIIIRRKKNKIEQ